MLIIFYCFTSHVYHFRLEIYNKTIIGFSFCFFPLEMFNKTIIGFGFCDMKNYHINISVRVISLAFGSAENSYLDIDNFAYYKNLIHLNMMSTVLLLAFRINFFLFIFLCESYIVWACRSVRNKLAMKQPVKFLFCIDSIAIDAFKMNFNLYGDVPARTIRFLSCITRIFFVKCKSEKRQWLLMTD